MELGDPPEPQASSQLPTDEHHRPAQGRDCLVALSRLADDAHPDAGVAQIGISLDLGHRDKTDARIGDVAGQDGADLLAELRIDPLCSLANRATTVAPRRPFVVATASSRRGDSTHRLRREALDDVALLDVVEVRQADAALEVGGHLANVVPEATQ